VLPERFLPRRLRRWVRPGRGERAVLRFTVDSTAADTSEFRLGRYVTKAVDCGAVTSVREMATSGTYHHFFQQSDAVKYTQIVERHLLQNIRTFLGDHNVDLADHDRAQTNILFGDNNQNIFGGENKDFGYNFQAAGTDSPSSQGEQPS
jgi:hypothetical protein